MDLPCLLWMKREEPDLYERIDKIFQPKDYIRYCMTGEVGTEESDASAALLMDVGKREWAWDVLEILGIRREILPPLGHSWEVAGNWESEQGFRWFMEPGISRRRVSEMAL